MIKVLVKTSARFSELANVGISYLAWSYAERNFDSAECLKEARSRPEVRPRSSHGACSIFRWPAVRCWRWDFFLPGVPLNCAH